MRKRDNSLSTTKALIQSGQVEIRLHRRDRRGPGGGAPLLPRRRGGRAPWPRPCPPTTAVSDGIYGHRRPRLCEPRPPAADAGREFTQVVQRFADKRPKNTTFAYKINYRHRAQLQQKAGATAGSASACSFIRAPRRATSCCMCACSTTTTRCSPGGARHPRRQSDLTVPSSITSSLEWIVESLADGLSSIVSRSISSTSPAPFRGGGEPAHELTIRSWLTCHHLQPRWRGGGTWRVAVSQTDAGDPR